MALTWRRWLAAAALGCLALADVYWPGAREAQLWDLERNSFLTRLHNGLEFRSRLQRNLERGGAVLLLRDHVLDSLARSHEPALPVSLRIGGVSPQLFATVLAPAVDSVVRFLSPATSRYRTVLVTHPDRLLPIPTGGTVSLYTTVYLMPGATDGRTCLVLAREWDLRQLTSFLSDTAARARTDRRSSLTRALGPCAFYTAFGPPGTDVERWLREQAYAVAGQAQWDRPQEPIVRRPEREIAEQNWSSVWELLRIGTSGGLDIAALSLPARGCAHGRLELCDEALRSRFVDWRRPLGGRSAVVERWWTVSDLADNYLSDLVRAQGRDRFVRFWSSSLPVDRAFTEVFGVSRLEWTHRWLLENIEEPHFGPVVHFSSVLVGLGLGLAFVAIAGLSVMRRQVG